MDGYNLYIPLKKLRSINTKINPEYVPVQMVVFFTYVLKPWISVTPLAGMCIKQQNKQQQQTKQGPTS